MHYGNEIGVAKVLQGEGPYHAGMAVVTDCRHVITCAHVVNTAAGRPIEETSKPEAPVKIAFPLSNSSESPGARVVVWHPIGDQPVADVAVLELVADVPQDVGTAIFARIYRSMDYDPLLVFGIPAGQPTGNHVEAKFMGSTSETRIQIDGLSQPGVFIQGGFSGGAVWNTAHQAYVGMVQAKRVGEQIKVAYMLSTEALAKVWPTLPMEDRHLPRSFNWIWTSVTSILFAAMLYAHIVVQTNALHPQLAAFFGMHAYAFLAPVVAWFWYLFARDFKLHDWPARLPNFANMRTDPNSRSQKAVWCISLLFLVLVPTYLQGHFLRTFQEDGTVYIYAKRFGLEGQLDRRPDGSIFLNVAGGSYRCFDRSNILCEHPDAGRYSTVSPKPPASNSTWQTYWDNAYHYGDLGRDPKQGSVTFWPILQPLVVIALTVLTLGILGTVFFQLFCGRRRAATRHQNATQIAPGTAP